MICFPWALSASCTHASWRTAGWQWSREAPAEGPRFREWRRLDALDRRAGAAPLGCLHRAGPSGFATIAKGRRKGAAIAAPSLLIGDIIDTLAAGGAAICAAVGAFIITSTSVGITPSRSTRTLIVINELDWLPENSLDLSSAAFARVGVAGGPEDVCGAREGGS